MQKVKIICTIAFSTILLSACTSTPTTSKAIKNSKQQYEITGLGKSAAIAKTNAIQAAHKTCPRKTQPTLIQEEPSFNGIARDSLHEVIRTIAIAFGAKSNPEPNKDEAYQHHITFTCQSN